MKFDIHIYVYTYIHTYIHIHTYTHTHTCTHAQHTHSTHLNKSSILIKGGKTEVMQWCS